MVAAQPRAGRVLRDDPIAPALALAIAAVATLGIGVELVHAASQAAWVEPLVPALSLSYEHNLPTWFASSLLFACALALGQLAARRPARRPDRWPWWGLAAALACASLDEAAELHENLAGLGGGLVYYDWIVPAALVVALLGAASLRFLRALPRPTRRRFLAAAAIYLGGALAMELPLGWWVEHAGDEGLGYALIDAIEETLELAGAAVFLLAVRAHGRLEPHDADPAR